MNKKSLKARLVAFVMVCVMAATVIASTGMTVSAATWRTGKFDGNNDTSEIIVTLDSASKDAKIKIHAYGTAGWPTKHKERDCNLYVTMRDSDGNWIWGGNINTGSKGKTMKLGCDHLDYRLYLKHPYSIHCWDYGHCCPDEWAVECKSNCSVS